MSGKKIERVMVDIETMGTGVNAAIVAIGAVRFGDGLIYDRFEAVVSLQSCLDIGMVVDGATVMWWMMQDNIARLHLVSDEEMSIGGALIRFTAWLAGNPIEVWANGSDFDLAILANAFDRCSLKRPWPYWMNRDYRTVKKLYPEIQAQPVGTKHRAVNDAERQALHLMEMLGI